ncbi:MAG: mce2D [Nocardia sp.]|uniref:MlaD family protein n=1 Tax=Nocardia sp. TaxID=1821 RepID=UPI002625A09E|nr:MlaD family protein [Nocardia sp.]MCU1646251.1 mce2D [Nocardia sp.]
MTRMLGSRAFMSVAGVVVLVAVTLFGYLIAFDPIAKTRGYCAIMPDGVGLYAGNHVTLRGIPVGTVTRIEPQGQAVRVDFTVAAAHPLRGMVSATTVSGTLVADRNLAVLSDGKAADGWNPDQCITRTLTPKSMTQTLNALAKLSGELTGGTDATQQDQVRDGIAALDTATAGAGPKFNRLIKDLGTALSTPDAAIGHIGALVDTLNSLSASVSGGWGDIKTMLTRFASVLSQLNDQVLGPAAQLIAGLATDLPMLNEVTTTLGGAILQGLDATVPSLRWIAANIGSLQEIITMIPPLAAAVRRSADPESGKPVLTYVSPNVALAQGDTDQLCGAIDAVAPGRCTAGAPLKMPLAQLVLGLAGAR